MDKMKVWIVGRGVPSPQNRMLGSFEIEQAEALAKNGVEVIYIGISVRSARNYHNIGFKTFDNFSIPTYSFNFPIGRFLPRFIDDKVYEMAFSSLSKRIINEYGMPDIIHIHYPSQRPYKGLTKLQSQGVKIVATEHWTLVQNMTIDSRSRKNLSVYISESNSFICVSSTLKQSVIKLTGTTKEIEVIPNLVNPVFNLYPDNRSNCFNYVVSGRLVENKQADKVVRAFTKVFSKDDNVSLTIAGSGELYSILRSIIIQENREKQIHLLGSVSREKMAEVMASADALVSYSRLETFCVPIIEAWMCGKPVIASSTIPVMVDYVDDRLGITVDEYEIETLESALRTMYNDYSKYDSTWIAQYARIIFSGDAVATRLIELYRAT